MASTRSACCPAGVKLWSAEVRLPEKLLMDLDEEKIIPCKTYSSHTRKAEISPRGANCATLPLPCDRRGARDASGMMTEESFLTPVPFRKEFASFHFPLQL
ncbi:hypothetical protein NPIL_280741 [Nephila pilipes]|uniref:Uncharacterized protein n=1 Tax=Nephila pilipes TaxID=299642 RepID=A0A8X6MFB1_NEPPI|nr:hypothetical protein NPIL_280741 [Nephila pilipes]